MKSYTITPKRSHQDFIQSACVTAMMRALLSESKDEYLQNPDYLAAKFVLKEPWSEYLKNKDSSIIELEDRVPGCIFYHLVRTKYFDEKIKEWCSINNDGQIIILGAGFDTRSIRFKEDLQNNIIYEVDLEAMLNYKIEIINKEIKTPNINIKHIPINFHEENLINSLKENKLKTDKKTLVLCEGLIYFLTSKTVNDLFISIASYIKEDLDIVFDYAYLDYVNGNLSYYGAKKFHEELKNIGEPHIFGIEPDKMNDFAKNLNFKVVNNHTANDLENKYLTNNNDLLAHIHGFHGMSHLKKYKNEF